jgi:raffinose/stachyose/melibiose transport system substrate-binding protein
MSRSRSIRLCLLLAGLVVVLVGAVGASASPKQEVTLRFSGAIEQRFGWDVMIQNFERVYPNIKIESTFVPFAQYQPLLLTQMQAGSEPDLFVTQAGASSSIAVYGLGAQGRLLDLTGSPWWKRTPKAHRKYVTVKGRVYAFSAGFTPQALMYNRDLFRQLGVNVPTTFAQLLAACQRIKAAGKIPIGISLDAPTTSGNLLISSLSSFVYAKDPDWTLKRIQKKVTFAGSPLWQRLMQAFVQMRDKGCFNPSPAATSRPAMYAMFANGQSLMMPAASSEVTVIKQINANANVGMFAFPADEARYTQPSVGTSLLELVASKRTEHPKEVKTFIDFVGRPKQNAVFAKAQAAVSGNDIVTGNVPDYLREMAAALKAGTSVATPVYGWPRPDKGLYIPLFTSQIPGLFTGQRTPEQILQIMDEAWDRP